MYSCSWVHLKRQFVCWIFFSNFLFKNFGLSKGFLNCFGTPSCSYISHFDLSYFSVNQIKFSPFPESFFAPFQTFAVLVIPRGVNRLLASHVVHRGGSLVCLSCLYQPPPFRSSAHSVHFFPSTTRYFVGFWISSDLRAITLESVTRQSCALPRLLVGDVSSRWAAGRVWTCTFLSCG